jgi:hypothetical protein
MILAAFVMTLVSLLPMPAFADEWNKMMRITVNQPFEIPGMVLPAGTYVVKLVDVSGDRHVVRFLNEDQSEVYATVMGIADFRLDPTDKPVFTFYESKSNQPKALRSWFYPGRQHGVEFAYPKSEAVEIAQVAEEPVVAYKVAPADLPASGYEKPSMPAIDMMCAEPLVAVKPDGEEVAFDEAYPEEVPVIEPEAAWEYEAPPPELPKTATPFTLVALVGLLAAGAATGIRTFRR